MYGAPFACAPGLLPRVDDYLVNADVGDGGVAPHHVTDVGSQREAAGATRKSSVSMLRGVD
jgi:hypothetical protein